jgi:multimeric flavodoxin WrbA
MRKKKLQALRNKTRSLNMSENEAEGIGYTTLKQYLQYVHENEDIAIEESVLAKELGMTLDEIRHPHILGARMNDLALKGNDPKSQQRFIRLQALKKRKEMLKRRSLMMGEDELDMNGVE